MQTCRRVSAMGSMKQTSSCNEATQSVSADEVSHRECPTLTSVLCGPAIANQQFGIVARAVCPHSLQHGDPLCKNGGRLHADNYTQTEPERYNNCVQCDCPDGWSGVDCSCEQLDLLL